MWTPEVATFRKTDAIYIKIRRQIESSEYAVTVHLEMLGGNGDTGSEAVVAREASVHVSHPPWSLRLKPSAIGSNRVLM